MAIPSDDRREVARYTVDGRVSLLADALMRHIGKLDAGTRADRIGIGNRSVAEIVVHETRDLDGSTVHEFTLVPGAGPDGRD